jgi:hypothetical protein
MRRATVCVFGLLALAVLASNVPAQIYRWVDDKGTVHFTDDRPANESGVEEAVEADARRTPMVRGGPEWQVDTPTPDFYEGAQPRDDRYYYDDDYDYDYDGPRDYPPLQGDTIIQVYEPQPEWFDGGGDSHRRKHRHDDGGHDGRRREGRDRYRDRETGPPVSAPPPRVDAPPVVAPHQPRASSRAIPRRR